MNPILNLKNIVIVLMIGLSIGFGGGYYTKGEFAKADLVDAVVKARHQTANDIQESLKVSAAIEDKVATSSENIETVRKAVAKRIKTQEVSNENARLSPNVFPAVCNWTLDVSTVGLLNSARAGTTPDSSLLGDAASQAPSGINASDFIDNDLQIVERYHELAINHDALVDYVESLIKKQAE